MSTYTLVAVIFVAVAAAVGILLPLLARRRIRPLVVVITAAVMLALTAVFDNLMIASGLFHYASAHLSGAMIGLAPLEDFAYPLAGALLLPGLWVLLRGRRGTADDEETGS